MDLLNQRSVIDELNERILFLEGYRPNLSLIKSNNNLSSCEAILNGTFTTIEGVQFTASMSASGSGNDCESAQNATIISILKTLQEFLNSYQPKIIKEVYTITTSCQNCVPVPTSPNVRGKITFELDAITQLVQTSPGVFSVCLRIGLGSGVPKPFILAEFDSIYLKPIADPSLGIPRMNPNVELTFRSTSLVPGNIVYNINPNPTVNNFYVRPDQFPEDALTALRSGILAVNSLSDQILTERLNLNRPIIFNNILDNTNLVSNNLQFTIENIFLSYDPLSNNIKNTKIKLEFDVQNVDSNNIIETII